MQDDQFDKALRKKVDEGEPLFDDAAWAKMEEKLDRHDRRQQIRFWSYAAAAVLLLGLLTWVLFPQPKGSPRFTRHNPVNRPAGPSLPEPAPGKSAPAKPAEHLAGNQAEGVTEKMAAAPDVRSGSPKPTPPGNASRTDQDAQQAGAPAPAAAPRQPDQPPVYAGQTTTPATQAPASVEQIPATTLPTRPGKRSRLPLSLSLGAGPDFSSTSHLLGGQANISAGLMVSVELSKRFSVATGARIGLKRYDATGLQYQMPLDPLRLSTVSGVDASCNVLEIPLQVSYAALNRPGGKLEFSAGLSSYLMLKETYRFDYTAASGYKPYTLVKNNANQHVLSVAHLSAAYYIDVANHKYQIGLEPYLKVPLHGVGEGKVHLKSSGISINLRVPLGTR